LTNESELDLFADTLRELFTRHALGDVEGPLETFGVGEFLADQPEAAVPIVFGLQGSNATAARTLSQLMLSRLGAVVGDQPSGWTPLLPGSPRAANEAGTLLDDRVEIDALCIGGPPAPSAVLSVKDGDGSTMVVTVDLEDPAISVVGCGGLDPWLHVHKITGATAPTARYPAASGSWASAVTWGRVALAHEIIGTARTSLALANEHAKERVQFGRPIGSFQAVKHRLAEVLIYLEAAQASADAAATSPTELGAMVAKSMSGKASRLAARNCLQVMGGMGFTWDHPLHRYQKRGLLLDTLLGSSTYLPAAIGSLLTQSRSAPRLVEL
jgi:hypothetical protein